jgi:hypothetical protein
MIIYWEMIPLVSGFIFGAILYSFYHFRSGGIITIPLLGVYTIKFPVMLPLILVSALLAYVVLQLIFTRYIIYGRRLLYVSLILGIVSMTALVNVLNIELEWFALLIPGIMGYNFHREIYDSKKHLMLSMVSNMLYFIVVVAIAFATIYFI